MHLVITTPLHIFLFDLYARKNSIIRTGDGYYYGITYNQGSVVLTHSGGYLQYFQEGAEPVKTQNHLIQPHQIEYIDDKILVSNTGKNCLSVFDEFGNLIRDVYLNEITRDDKNKGWYGNHFNSIHKHGERIYFLAHNYDRPSELWILRWPDLTFVEKITTNGTWAHNIWIGERGCIICNSKDASLLDVKTSETIWTSNETGAISRGLAVSDEYIFVGYSKFNEREDRYWETGGFWIIERDTLNTVDKISLPGSGVVHEIRIIGYPDYCHNGTIIPGNAISSIRKTSFIINSALAMRVNIPLLQRNIFGISTIVKFRQMIPRWQKKILETIPKRL